MTEGRGKKASPLQPAFKQSAGDTIDMNWSTVALGKVERVFPETCKLMKTRDYLPSVWSIVGPVFEEGVPPRSLFHLKAPLLVSFHPQRSWFWVKNNKRAQKLWLLTFYIFQDGYAWIEACMWFNLLKNKYIKRSLRNQHQRWKFSCLNVNYHKGVSFFFHSKISTY